MCKKCDAILNNRKVGKTGKAHIRIIYHKSGEEEFHQGYKDLEEAYPNDCPPGTAERMSGLEEGPPDIGDGLILHILGEEEYWKRHNRETEWRSRYRDEMNGR